jgi:hypothetical protein
MSALYWCRSITYQELLLERSPLSARPPQVVYAAHIYSSGSHGMGLGPLPALHPWTGEMLAWLDGHAFLPPQGTTS